MTTTKYLTEMNRFRFVRSIRNNEQALYAEKIFNQISFTPEQLNDLKSLHRYAKTLHRLDENECNGWPMEKTEYREGKVFRYSVEDLDWKARDEKKHQKMGYYICAIAQRNGWTVELQGDPRGWPLTLKVNGVDCSVLVNYK